MKNELVCQKCGAEGSIEWRFDAWARLEVTGIDAHGNPLKSAGFDTDIFDRNLIECSACERLFTDQGVVELLRQAELGSAQ
jgi:hypothetical protein